MLCKPLLAAALTVTLGIAQADPVATLNGASFVEYLGSTPTAVQQDATVFWFLESSNQTYNTGSGTVQVDSWFIVFDPLDGRGAFNGSINFGAPIVALQETKGQLLATAAFGKAGSSYNYAPIAIGLEATDRQATSFAGAVLTIADLNPADNSLAGWRADSPGDHLRVLTVSAVPEPDPKALLLAGLGVVALLARRRSGG
jgi:hypothetical protein